MKLKFNELFDVAENKESGIYTKFSVWNGKYIDPKYVIPKDIVIAKMDSLGVVYPITPFKQLKDNYFFEIVIRSDRSVDLYCSYQFIIGTRKLFSFDFDEFKSEVFGE